MPALHSLWPVPEHCPPPFAAAARAMYTLTASLQLLWTDAQVSIPITNQNAHTFNINPLMVTALMVVKVLTTIPHVLQGGRWIPPSSAILVDAAPPPLLPHLLHDGMPLVQGMPAAVTAALLQHCPGTTALSPAAVRAHMAHRMRAHPLLDEEGPGRGPALQAVLLYCMQDVQHLEELAGLYVVPAWCCLVTPRTFVLFSCSIHQIVTGVPVALVGGSVGVLKHPPELLLVPEAHRALLEGTPLLSRVVDVPDDSDLVRRLQQVGGTMPLTAPLLAAHVLPRMLGEDGRCVR